MIARLAILGAALLLAGCNEPTPEQRQRVRQSLPPGCTLFSLGDYGHFEDLVVITCGGPRHHLAQPILDPPVRQGALNDYGATFFIKPRATT